MTGIASEMRAVITFECQVDGLEMSLESGLGKLAGLKSLKLLDIIRLKPRIGVEEVRWMTEQWPRLRTLNGLERACNTLMAKYAMDWLREHHPEIDVKSWW